MPHSPEVAAALEKSIEKWKKNTTVEDIEDAKIGIRECPLCSLFRHRECDGCPVWRRTGETCCADTPYESVVEWFMLDRPDAFRAAALEEVAFLESLRDPG